MMRLKFSRRIINIRYDTASASLTTIFSSGIVRTYLNVPEYLYRKFSKAQDKDIFYEEFIEAQFALKSA